MKDRARVESNSTRGGIAAALRYLAYPALIVLSVLVVYRNSVGAQPGQFIFDDIPSIVENGDLRSLRTAWSAAFPRNGVDHTLAGRPVAAISFALNWAMGGEQIRAYRIVNVSIHALAALLLYGIVGRTLRSEPLRDRFRRHAELLALAVTLIWAVHPLCVPSVTYIVQRVESLAGLTMLGTLYCFIRGSAAQNVTTRATWFTLAVLTCALGMGAKETMAVAPLLVLLYDRTFLCESFSRALRRRTPLYLGLAVSLVILAILVAASPRTALFTGSRGQTMLGYLRTQCWAIPHYLRLSIFPLGTVLDYGGPPVGTPFVSRPIQYLPGAILLLLLIGGTFYALIRRMPIGFAGAWFFLILAPSSSIIPIAAEIAAEHRMYLSLAAVVAVIVLGVYRFIPAPAALAAITAGGAAASVVLGVMTFNRNALFQDVSKLWANDVTHRPDNARTRTALGAALAERERFDEALEHLDRAVKLHPRYAEAHHNIGDIMAQKNRFAEAEQAYRIAAQLPPPSYNTHYNFGQLLLIQGRLGEAADQYREAARHAPRDPLVWNAIGVRLAQVGALSEAADCFRKVLEIEPDNRDAAENLQRATQLLGRQ